MPPATAIRLADQLQELGAHPRAIPWTIRFHAGHSAAAPRRDYTIFAPANRVGIRAVLSRLHNGVLMLNPAAVELDAEVEDLGPLWDDLRKIHRINLVRRGEPVVWRARDVPAIDDPDLPPPEPGLAVGLDIGGTSMKAVALRVRAEATSPSRRGDVVVATAGSPTWPEGERGVEGLIARAQALAREVAQGEPIGSLGIGLAAPMGVGGRVAELSTVLRDRVGDTRAFDRFAQRVAEGLCRGPVAMFNDLSNLGRYLSATGSRRMVRFQIGTSFGGCWIDSDGMVYATEMGRLIVDVSDDAPAHPYLPIRGTTRTSLSNLGLVSALEAETGERVSRENAGRRLRALLEAGEAAGDRSLARLGHALRAAVLEVHALMPGVTQVECGGSMLSGPAGRELPAAVGPDLPVNFVVARQPAHDGAIAAALAPRLEAPLKGMRQVDS